MPSRRARRVAQDVAAIYDDNHSHILPPSIKMGEKRQPTEGATGVALKPEGVESSHLVEIKSPLCQTRDLTTPAKVTESLPLRIGKPQSSNSMPELNPPSSGRRPSFIMAKSEAPIPKTSFGSPADENPAFADPEFNATTTHTVSDYSVADNASNQANQWPVIQGRRANEEHQLAGLKAGNETANTARTYLEEFSEGHANVDVSASEISAMSSSSIITGLVDDNDSCPGYNTNSADSAEKRKQKTPKQLERARERQRLARRAKRAAKALRRREGCTVLDNDGISENPENSVQDSNSQEKDVSPGVFSRLENNELQVRLRVENSALRASHERELQRMRQLVQKQKVIIGTFLRGRGMPLGIDLLMSEHKSLPAD